MIEFPCHSVEITGAGLVRIFQRCLTTLLLFLSNLEKVSSTELHAHFLNAARHLLQDMDMATAVRAPRRSTDEPKAVASHFRWVHPEIEAPARQSVSIGHVAQFAQRRLDYFGVAMKPC
jgi:hypothetical protein